MNYSGDETPVLNAPARFESPSMSDTDTATFLIDAKGVIRRIWRKVKVAGHAAEVLVNGRRYAVVRERQTPKDLVRGESVAKWLKK